MSVIVSGAWRTAAADRHLAR